MTNLELQMLLDELVEMPFLDAFIKIQETNKTYRQSDFYKTTRISLEDLLNRYLTNISLKHNVKEQILDLINFMNTKAVAEKIKDVLLQLLNEQEIKDKISSFSSQFDLESLLKQSEELDEIIKDLK